MDDAVRDEIAFIRSVIEEGRGYASNWSGDMLVWGLLIAAAALGHYATIRGWWAVDPGWVWLLSVALGWVYSLQRRLRWMMAGAPAQLIVRPMARALRTLWVGCGIFLTSLYVVVSFAGDLPQGWLGAVSAGILGVGFFASAPLANLAWMRWVAVGWWIGEIVLYALRHRPEVLLVMTVLWLALLAVPGFVVLRSRGSSAAA